jgi:3',5'-cyclic-AMP phosphodiesterase
MKRLAALLALTLAFSAAAADFHFVLLGDRTGEVQPGVFEKVLSQAAAARPAFLLTIGDTIQGGNDETAENEWKGVERILAPYRAIPLYLTPGNHDVWSALSESLFRKYAGHPLHYSFDYEDAHFAVLDNSRSDAMPAAELAWLENDLRAHAKTPVKMVISHRPSWIMDAALGNTNSALHKIAKQYGVCCVLAGHVHQLIHADLDGVTYLAAPSAGGHLRLSGKYEDGWFFGWTKIDVKGAGASLEVHSVEGAVTPLSAWGRAGLLGR